MISFIVPSFAPTFVSGNYFPSLIYITNNTGKVSPKTALNISLYPPVITSDNGDSIFSNLNMCGFEYITYSGNGADTEPSKLQANTRCCSYFYINLTGKYFSGITSIKFQWNNGTAFFIAHSDNLVINNDTSLTAKCYANTNVNNRVDNLNETGTTTNLSVILYIGDTNVNEQNLISLIFPSHVPPCSDTIGTNLNCC